ncbi:hypothetical protein HBA55_28710 [Pseudomaricurvus alkylphenolicus]|uniref:hypothetical protein n=1 Tax=Pseudomaricurvus alkylphenolicus TaxID=1306991 RepID=UPI00141F7CD1|nr:hypothetical protein [Pseudomaricurvus alkylphenolicus]NIB43624.1 hypothetical protein [Pseudomaricurvus alkylphenolicus]
MSEFETLLTRRKLLQLAAASTSLAMLPACAELTSSASESQDTWNQGELAHLIPLVNHEQLLIKTSFVRAQDVTPYLSIDGRKVAGRPSDTLGRFWQFHAAGLQAGRQYELQLQDRTGKALTDPWPLKTFPHPDATPDQLRILAYTCAGGNEALRMDNGTPFFLPMAARHRLLQRGMDFNPDVVISNGDHIYWDQRTVHNKPDAFKTPWLELFKEYGSLDPKLPMLGSPNEEILTRIVDPQIAYLYGVRFRSTPVFMLTDDHDMFENDEANDDFITLPPDQHMLASARTTQYLYYPEFLPDANRPQSLSGCNSPDRSAGLSEVYGTLRYGKLLEALMYDTKRYCSIDGESAFVFPPNTEQWLADRTATEDTRHLLHIPSTPIGWSAGKWGEWYPDIRQSDGSLGQEKPKPYWPRGWWSQHQRILKMLQAQKKRTPVIASGDLHALSYGQIARSGELDFGDNPIHSFCVGPLGSSGPGFPTQYRGIGAQVPSDLDVKELLKPLENNGFSLIDVTADKLVFDMFNWLPPQPVEDIDQLQPSYSFEVKRLG